jgi:hypothetical protein
VNEEPNHRTARQPGPPENIKYSLPAYRYTLHTCRLAVLQRKANNKEQEEKDREFQVREDVARGVAGSQGCSRWPVV